MKGARHSRLGWLLVALVAALALRWWDPIGQRDDGRPAPDLALAQAVVRAPAPAATATAGFDDPFAGTRLPEAEEPRNAFASRLPPEPPPPPPAPPPVLRAVPQPPPPPPPATDLAPSPPPVQVFGTWRDERGPSVFVSGPQGVQMVRAGDLVLSQYRVTQILPQQLLLQHLPSGRDLTLPIPVAAATPAVVNRPPQ